MPLSESAIDVIAGSAAGVGLVLSGQPFDTLKVRMQTSSMGLGEAFKKTAAEGPLGFYKGVASPLVGVSICNSVLFAAYNWAIRQQAGMLGIPPSVDTLPLGNIFIAGSVAGGAAAFIEGPVDLFKSKMQVQYAGGGQYKNTFDCVAQIAKGHGIKGVYQGHSATLVRNIPANALYLGVYEYVKRLLTPEGKKLSTAATLTAGAAGGVAYWGLCYPTDIIKSKLQTDHSDPAKRKFTGMVDCARKTYSEGGIKSLYRGFTPCMLRAIPANAIGFMCYEAAASALRQTS